jgi:cytochrome c2
VYIRYKLSDFLSQEVLMKSRMFLVASLLLAGTLLLVSPALAGGWAVITLDELPGEIVAGGPLEIGFTVRQHGVTPLDGLTPTVHARQAGFTLTEQAKAQGGTGHYVATLTFPQAGEWTWSIEAFTGNQPMPPLSVIAAPAVTKSEVQNQIPANLPLLAGSLGLIGLAVGLFVAMRRKARWAIALVVAGLVLSAGSIVSAAQQPATEPEAKVVSPDPAISQVEVGRRLFIAKGCMVCHSHSETNAIREIGVDMGPNLTNIKASPEYLRLWLKDPQSAKSTAKMPNLGLSEIEIEALIAFINAD